MHNRSRPSRRVMSRTLLLGALVGAWTIGAVPGHATATEAHAENAGIFTMQIPEDGSDIAGGRAVIVVDKPIEEVLPIVLDYANYVQFMPNFTKSRVLAQRGSRAMVYMEVSVAKGMYTLYGQLNLAEGPQDGESRIVEGRLLEGNIDAFNASFKLTPVDAAPAPKSTSRSTSTRTSRCRRRSSVEKTNELLAGPSVRYARELPKRQVTPSES